MTTDKAGASERAVAADAAEPVVSALRASIPDAAWEPHTVAVWQRWTYGGFEIHKKTFDGPWRVSYFGEEIGRFEFLQTAMKEASRHAQAIEARRAETGTGSVHESAVGDSQCAQTPPGDNA